MGVVFDTHEFVKELRRTGVPEDQAEVHAKAFVKYIMDNVASKSDIGELKWEMDAKFADMDKRMDARFVDMEKRMDARFVDLEKRTEARFVDFERRMEAGFAEMNKRIAVVEAKLIYMQTIMFGTFAGIVALVIKAFWPH